MGIRKTIAVLPGDGIGPEVTSAAVAILEDCAAQFEHHFEFIEQPIGGAAIAACRQPLPADTLAACLGADAVLLGAVGGPSWDHLPLAQRPERGLLELRRELGLYINVRPAKIRPALRGISPLRPERIRAIDFEIVRELAGGIYFGPRSETGHNGTESACDTEIYTRPEIERIAAYAFARAGKRKRRLTSVDKANVLASSRLWRKTVQRVATHYPSVRLEHAYVDNMAMQLVLRPEQYDVILTSNMFGDILSDEAAALAGSIGLAPSMSFGDRVALYEPIHGSAPALAGQDHACPVGAILCAAMMLRESFGLEIEADWVESAVDRTLRDFRTPDICEDGKEQRVSGSALTRQIRGELAVSVAQTEHYGWGV